MHVVVEVQLNGLLKHLHRVVILFEIEVRQAEVRVNIPVDVKS
jgi:hypothetical protein